MDLEELKESECVNLYPPCFVVKLSGDGAAEDSIAVFTFEGATKKIKLETLLTRGVVQNFITVLSQASPYWHLQLQHQKLGWAVARSRCLNGSTIPGQVPTQDLKLTDVLLNVPALSLCSCFVF